MPLSLTPMQVVEAYTLDDARRVEQTKRYNYRLGTQAILELDDERLDGSARHKVVTNWIKHIIDTHSGFIASTPIKYVPKDPDDKQHREALSNLYDVTNSNSLNAIDLEHLENALLMGFSVEVHSIENGEITITSYDPRNWGFIYDSDGTMVAAIYKTVFTRGTLHRGELLDADVTQYTVYDDSKTYVFDMDKGKTEPKVSFVYPHYYGRPPVVVMRVNKPGDGYFISDALLSQQDVWNSVRSSNADDVTYNVDSLLCIKGYDPAAFFQADEDGVLFIDKLRQHRILPLNHADADASFLVKGNTPEKISHDLNLTRSDLHMMSRLTDLALILGATGTASGIALKLKLQPQIEQAGVFTTYMEAGIRDRISLFNTMWEKMGKPTLVDYDVQFTLNIPVNEQEIWQSLPSIDHLLTIEDQIRMIPSVRNPEKAARSKRDELKEQQGVIDAANSLSVDPSEDPTEPVGAANLK